MARQVSPSADCVAVYKRMCLFVGQDQFKSPWPVTSRGVADHLGDGERSTDWMERPNDREGFAYVFSACFTTSTTSLTSNLLATNRHRGEYGQSSHLARALSVLLHKVELQGTLGGTARSVGRRRETRLNLCGPGL